MSKTIPRVVARVGSPIQKTAHSHLFKTKPVALKIWSCLTFNEQHQIVKMKASLLKVENNDHFIVDGFCCHCTIVFEVMVCFYPFCPCQEVRSCFIGEGIKRGSRESSMNWDEVLYRKKASLLANCWSVNTGKCTRQPILLKNIFEKNSLTDIHWQLSNNCKKKRTENYLAKFNAILKYLKNWDPILLTSLQSSRTLLLAKMTWKT